MGGLTLNGSVDEENGQQYDSGAYGDPCEDQDDDLNNEYNAADMADLYDPCVQDDYADMQGGERAFILPLHLMKNKSCNLTPSAFPLIKFSQFYK